MRNFQKISAKIGLTQTELKVFFFLIAVFFVGLVIKFLDWDNENPTKNNFDYSAIDSIFYSSNKIQAELLENNLFDSNQESSDFNKSNFKVNKKNQELTEKSINLNEASLEELIILPGIGIKTAEKILAFRRASGGFTNIKELLEIKGIGDFKFNKIKKYIFIQQKNKVPEEK
jgi:competence protein ComEA